MTSKTVLLIDDEQVFLEPLADALEFEGHRVLRATSGSEALELLEHNRVDLVTIDIMLDPGESLVGSTDPHGTGLFLCEEITRRYPNVDAFCISVVSEIEVIRYVESLGVRFLRKGETPLRTVIGLLRSKLTGVAYDSERDRYGRFR